MHGSFLISEKSTPLIKFYLEQGDTMSLIYIRQAAKNDLEQIMPIIDEAKKLLKEEGEPAMAKWLSRC